MADTGDDALIGRLVSGRYVIGKRIARGGMASVFMATDTRLDRVVAMKIMHAGLADDPSFTERFVREARTVAQLNHPNVVSVFDQGTDAELTYLVMEYVPGKTLREVMRNESPMNPAKAMGYMEQILVALSAAHAASMIHRDVKPENVLITPDGTVKVADFGLARAVSAATTATGGTLIGTVSYLAPEIVVNAGADARSDVYACGAILYEMLTGFKPHTGDSPIQVAYKHVHEDVPKPSALVHNLPDYVDALVQRTTARDRDRRTADALVMLQQVRQVRRALDAGLANDPELTQDLVPPFGEAEPVFRVPPPLVDVSGNAPTVVTQREPEPTVITQTGDSHTQILASEAVIESESGQRANRTKPVGEKRRGGRIALVLVVVLALIAGVLGWYLSIGRYTEAPDLIGMSLDTATVQADAEGFVIKVGNEIFSETEAPNTIVETDPPAGDRILPGDTIEVTISKGRESYELPDVRGASEETAIRLLEEVTVTVSGTEERYSAKYDAGLVIGVIGIKPGETVANGTAVKLAVSKGKEPVDLANWVGKKASEAIEALEEQGLVVEREEVFSDDYDRGVIAAQSPDAGKVFKGDTVTLSVSQGPEFVKMPNVKGKSMAEATRQLQNLGLKVNKLGNKKDSATVIIQDPNQGTRVRNGSTVNLFGN